MLLKCTQLPMWWRLHFLHQTSVMFGCD